MFTLAHSKLVTKGWHETWHAKLNLNRRQCETICNPIRSPPVFLTCRQFPHVTDFFTLAAFNIRPTIARRVSRINLLNPSLSLPSPNSISRNSRPHRVPTHRASISRSFVRSSITIISPACTCDSKFHFSRRTCYVVKKKHDC